MRLERHEMAGFCHLSGPFVLDLRNVPPGLVALRGPNGAGKTSYGLDGPLAGLYGPGAVNRAFASREGTLASYATSREAYIDDLWTLEGIGTFRVRVNVDNKRRLTSATLLEVLHDGRQVPLNNGQSSTFRQAVTERFPSQRALLASAFSGQTRRGSFGELGQKERMELFVELADLSHLQEKAVLAGQLADTCLAVAERIRAAVAVLAVAPGAVQQAQQHRDELAAALDSRLAEHTTASLKATFAERLVEQWVAEAQRYATAAQVAENARVDLRRLEATLSAALQEDYTAAMRKALVAAEARRLAALAAVTQRKSRAQKIHDEVVADRTSRIANNQGLLEKADRYRAAAQRQRELREVATTARATAAEHRRHASDATAKMNDAKLDVARLQSAQGQRVSLQRTAGLLGTVKFGEECAVEPVCPLVTDAVDARAKADAIAKALEQLPVAQTALESWAKVVAEHVQAAQAADAIAAQADKDAGALTRDADMVPHIDVAESKMAGYRADLETAAKQLAEALAASVTEAQDAEVAYVAEAEAAKADEARQLAEREQRVADLQQQNKGAGERLRVAEAEAAALADAPQRLRDAQAKRAEAEQQASELRATCARLEAEHTAAQAAVLQLQQRIERSAAAGAHLREAEDEGLAWQTLARALGRDGLQRLEVDAAGPQVSDLANRLLEVGYGPRFSINVVTQVATADRKDVKERFTIEVTDNEHGGEPRDIGDLSGGERVVVDEALRAALACYVNLRSRQRCRTLWRDETTGALYPESRAPYVAMLRKLRELSGADHVLFITHDHDVAELADVVVEVRDGIATVRSAA